MTGLTASGAAFTVPLAGLAVLGALAAWAAYEARRITARRDGHRRLEQAAAKARNQSGWLELVGPPQAGWRWPDGERAAMRIEAAYVRNLAELRKAAADRLHEQNGNGPAKRIAR